MLSDSGGSVTFVMDKVCACFLCVCHQLNRRTSRLASGGNSTLAYLADSSLPTVQLQFFPRPLQVTNAIRAGCILRAEPHGTWTRAVPAHMNPSLGRTQIRMGLGLGRIMRDERH